MSPQNDWMRNVGAPTVPSYPQQQDQHPVTPDIIKQLIAMTLANQQPQPAQQGMSTPPAQVQQQIGAMNTSQARQDYTQGQGQGVQGSQVAADEKSKKHSQFLRSLFKLGIPVGAAAVGLASGRALPGATGFASGFVDETQRQAIAEQDKKDKQGKIKIVKKDGSVYDTHEIVSEFDKIIDQSKTKEDVRDQILKGLLGIETPDGEIGDAAAASNQNIKDINFKTRDEAIKFLQEHGKAINDNNINKVLGN